MISSSIEMYLDTLAGFIFDDDKLVTYKWLSKELGLHVNLCKQILWQFLREHKKGKEVLATFTLIGYLEDDYLRVEVVKESDLSSAKKKFRKLTVEHLYSLQRTLPDIELLALTGTGDHRQAAIVCKEISPRQEEELRVLRWGSRGIAVENTSGNSSENTSKPASKNGPKHIFGKVNSEKITGTINKQPILARGRKRQGSEDGDQTMVSKRQKKREFQGDSRSTENSSDDENEEADIPCPSEVEAPIPSKNPAQQSPPKYKIEDGKRKVRKIVDKISKDANGYLVTNKEYVYETCSEDEESKDAAEFGKIEAPKSSNKAAVPKTNRKQASLLNFFKKS